MHRWHLKQYPSPNAHLQRTVNSYTTDCLKQLFRRTARSDSYQMLAGNKTFRRCLPIWRRLTRTYILHGPCSPSPSSISILYLGLQIPLHLFLLTYLPLRHGLLYKNRAFNRVQLYFTLYPFLWLWTCYFHRTHRTLWQLYIPLPPTAIYSMLYCLSIIITKYTESIYGLCRALQLKGRYFWKFIN